jgi:glucan phosphoethanolaminetransferase (alkaline phosphatase superfamily)
MNPTQPPVAPPRRNIAFPVVGGLLVAAVFVAAVFATAVVYWSDSVCNVDTTTVNAYRHALRQHLLLLWVLVTGGPVFFGVVARTKHRRIWPWATVAGVFLFIALFEVLSAQPSTWCLY